MAQSPGFNKYGKSVSLMRIDAISPSIYIEKNVEQIFPFYDNNIKGIHTISENSNFTVIDF